MKNELSRLLDSLVGSQQLPGINILVLKNGSELFYHQAGFRDIERSLPFDRDTILRMYSMSKPLTGFAAMLLLERGVITLGDAVERYIPEFSEIRVFDKESGELHRRFRPVYIKDLLCMTSGLAYPGEDESDKAGYASKLIFDELDSRLYTDAPMTTMELAKKLAACGCLAFEPGSAWLYGTGADVMGAVIEAASGVSFDEFMKEEIFSPLGMKDTGYFCREDSLERLAVSYEFPVWELNPFAPEQQRAEEKGNWRVLGRDHLGIKRRATDPPAFVSGGAGVYSTLDDYARFAQMLLGGGEFRGKRLLSEPMTAFFTAGGLTPWQKEHFWRTWDSLAGYDYGNFMRVATGAGFGQFPQIKGEYGWDGWLGTFFMNVPERGVTMLVGAQVGDAGALPYLQQIRNVIYQFLRKC